MYNILLKKSGTSHKVSKLSKRKRCSKLLGSFTLFSLIFSLLWCSAVFAAVPANQDFEAVSSSGNSSTSRTIDGITYSSNGVATVDVIDDVSSYYSETFTGFSGKAIINDTSGTADSSISFFQFGSASVSDKFKLVSLAANAYDTAGSFSSNFVVTGYSGGSGGTQVVQVTGLNFSSSGTYGSGNAIITYTKLSSTYNAGSLTFGSAWNNIDTVRFVGTNGSYGVGLALDSLVFTASTPALSQVANAVLSASGVASWDNVANESNFEVQLYKDGNPQGAAVTKSADTLTYDFLSAMRSAGAGVYTVKVTAKGDGTNYVDGPQSAASGSQTIAALAPVSAGLTWTGDVAYFTTVPSGVSYDVQLYKDGNSLNVPVNVVAASAAAGVDFTAAIAAGGGGTYTYKVTAIGNATLILDAAQSVASNNNIKAIQLAQVTNTALSTLGVASWNNLANESNFEVQLYKDGNPEGAAVTKAADTLSHNFLVAMRAAGAGVYTVKVTAKGNGTTYSDGPQSVASGSQTIVQLATVTDGLAWAGNVANFTTVSNAVSYNVQLYKDSSSLNAPVNVVAASAASGVDFATAIASGGGGTYTYKVTAKGDGVLLLDAAQSAASNGNLIATPLSQVTNATLSASGVASWDNVANETSFEVQLYKGAVAQGTAVSKTADTLSHDFLADMRSAGAGIYIVKVTAKGDGTNYSDGPQSAASGSQTIAALAPVSAGLTWTGDVAHFTAVANAVSYNVQLYKDGSALNSPVNVVAASAGTGADFAAAIAAGGGGTYAYRVTAIADATTLLLDAAQSGASNNNIKAIQLAQVTGATLSATGVISWNAVPNAVSYEVEVFNGGISQGTAGMVPGSSILPAMRSGGAGAYTIKVKAKGDGTIYADGLQSIDSASQSIVKLSTVSAGLTWTGNVAHFTTVPSGVSYDVQLYKDGSALNSPVNVVEASAGAGVDFAAAIVAGGAGTYTYKVAAKGDGVLLLDAAQSAFSNGNLIATPLPQVINAILSASGVASWDNVANESNFEVQLYKGGVAQGGAVTKAADTLSHDFLTAMRSAGAGIYTVKVTAKGDGTNYSDGLQSAASGSQTIAVLATVSAGLTWTGDVAHFTTVANAVSYDVQLYKDGNSLNAPVNVVAASAAAGVDFTAAIAASGGGTYTYKVTAIGNATLILDAAQSSVSNNNLKVIQLAQVTNVAFSALGVASWDNVANESNFEVQLYNDGNPEGTAVTKAVDAVNHDFLSAMRGAGAGVYTVKVTAKGNGTTYSDGVQSAVSGSQTIVQLSAVSAGLTWIGNVANFTTVPSGVSYDVQLYKDGNSLNAPVNVVAASAAAGADFTAAIAAGGAGTYTYKVTAKGDAILILDAIQSITSNGNIKSPAPNTSTITPGTAIFDKYIGSANYKDVAVSVDLKGNTLTDIKNQTVALTEGVDYTTGSAITIKKEYLGAQPTGNISLTFEFSAGGDKNLGISIADSTPTQTQNQNQNAPTGLLGIAPTSSANNNGKIAGTTAAMEYKLASTAENTYAACSVPVTTVAVPGDYVVRFAAKTGYNVGTTAAITVPAYAVTATTYTLTYAAGANGITSGAAIQVVKSGASGTPVTAVANAGYYFVGWSDGLTTATRTDSNVTANKSVTATFAVTTSSSDGGSSASSGSTSTSTTTGTTTINANVVDDKTGQTVKSIEAQVTMEANGTKTVAMKSSDAIVIEQTDGTRSPLNDFSKLGFSTPVTTGTGSVSVTIAADGTIQVKGLANNTESQISITYDLGNGQKITIGSMDVKVGSNGEVTLTSSLIDPYGIITDEATGKAIDGVNVILYYANTSRNKAAGKTPDTVVALPGIDGFKPNNNKNPQISDASGAYGFMVFPTSDYYIVATKDGYDKYTSPTISVEQEIVKWDFKMKQPTTETKRLAGQSRVDTAIAIAKATYSNTISNVILATSENYPDALSGSVLAYKLNAPILLVGTSTEDQEEVLSYLKDNMDVSGTVYILGGSGVVSVAMEAKVTSIGLKNIIRLGGVDRYETAVKIADTIGVKEGTPIVIVSGENYPDALSVSSVAAVNQYPILIANKDGISDSVKNEIGIIKPSKVFIIGLQGSVSSAVEDQVTQTGAIDKTNIVRIGGTDRYQTSLEVAKYFDLSGTITCIATGNDFPDALAGSVYAAKNNASIILTNSTLSDSEITYLKNKKIINATIFGGLGAISKDVEQQLTQIFGQ